MEWISCLSEAIVLIWIIHALMHKNICLNYKLILFLSVDVVIFGLINARIFPMILQIVVYIFLFAYLLSEFKGFPLRKIIESVLVSVFVTAGIQIISYLLLFMIPTGKMRLVLANAVMLLITWFMTKVLNYEKIITYVTRNNYILKMVAQLSGVLILIIILLFKSSDGLSLLNCLLLCIIILMIFVFFQQWKIQTEVTKYKEREIRVLKQSMDSFAHLINDVQARQHEFNNQIETLYSMHYVYNTYEELVQHQKEYITNASDKNHFNQLLTAKCSPIIKGFLYYKFEYIQQQGIMVDYQINLEMSDMLDMEFDILECIGILLDNAREAICEDLEIAKINFVLSQKNDKILVRVENPAGYLSQSEINMMTKLRYSTKGDNRGFGLHNIKKIVKKYKGMILVENEDKAGQNWVSVCLELCNNY